MDKFTWNGYCYSTVSSVLIAAGITIIAVGVNVMLHTTGIIITQIVDMRRTGQKL